MPRLHKVDSLFGRMLSDSHAAAYRQATDEDGHVDEERLDRWLGEDDELEEEILRSAEVVALFVEAARP